MSYERMMKMKILKCSIIFIMLLAGYSYFENVASTTQHQNEVPKIEKIKQKNWKYQEYSNIFEGASRKCGNSDTYYFENVEVIDINRENNRLFVTLRNHENKRYSAFIQYKQLPDFIPKKIDVVVSSFVKQSLPPILYKQ